MICFACHGSRELYVYAATGAGTIGPCGYCHGTGKLDDEDTEEPYRCNDCGDALTSAGCLECEERIAS